MTRGAWLGVVLAIGLVAVVFAMRVRAESAPPAPTEPVPGEPGGLDRVVNLAQRALAGGSLVAGTLSSFGIGGGATATAATTAATASTAAAVPAATSLTEGGSALATAGGVGVGGIVASVAVVGALVAFTVWVISWHGEGMAFQREQDRRVRQLHDYQQAAEQELNTTIYDLTQRYQIGLKWLFLGDFFYNAAASEEGTAAAGAEILDLVDRAKRGVLIPHTTESLETQTQQFQTQLDERARLARLAETRNVFATEEEAAAAGFGEGQY
jgi:hypothetical protein